MQHTQPSTEFLCGRNAVQEALRAGRTANTLLVARGAERVRHLVAMAKERGAVVKEVPSSRLDAMFPGLPHQGVALSLAPKEYVPLETLLARAQEKGEAPFLLLCDGLSDPHNLGALLRTADACGVHGVVIPERGSVGLGATVGKAAAGAMEYVPVARVKNLAAAIDTLKAHGVWIYCADMDGQDFRETDFSGPAAIVVGAEGSGVSRLVREKSDFVVSIPMKGQINSLNASVAGALLLFEAARGR